MPTTLINALLVRLPEHGGPCLTALRVGCGRILALGAAPRRADVIVDLAGRAVYPGLINAHDHLELNHYPRTRFRDVYDNAHQWGEEFLLHLDEQPFAALRRLPLDEQCRIGGLKNLCAGVTTVAHHNPLHHPLRRRDFPVRVLRRYGWAHSLHFTKASAIHVSCRRTPRTTPWMIHLAEGCDRTAADELRRLHALGCLRHNTVLIHGVGLSEADRDCAVNSAAGLVWCPSSNFFLLGQTAEVRLFAARRKLALGSDSRLTADGDLLDELRAAHSTGQLSAEQLFRSVTTDAARLLRVRAVGALLPGFHADFFIAPAAPDPFAALVGLTPSQIEAVYIGGQLRHAAHRTPELPSRL